MSRKIGYLSVLLGICIIVLSGCASLTVKNLQREKDKNQNTVTVQVPYDIENAKKIVKECIKEANLVERHEIEKPDFIFANTGNYFGKSMATLGIVPTYNYSLGFFFNYDDKTKTTTITIAEYNTGGAAAFGALGYLGGVPSIRYTLADKIKLKSQLLKSN